MHAKLAHVFWHALHRAAEHDDFDTVLNLINHLPCRTCRTHSRELLAGMPPFPPRFGGVWLWHFHNRVNRALHKQIFIGLPAPVPKMSDTERALLSRFVDLPNWL